MVVLILAGFVAGAGAALSPCVLPVLPALLSSTATGGRRRPAGVVLGLAVTFTISIAVLASVAKGTGLGNSTLRDISIGVLLVFGVVLLVPSVTERVERPLAGLSRFGPKSRGDGFWSGTLVGAALGFVYTPCAGPVLAAVIALGASGHTTGDSIGVAIAYGVGTAVVLFGLAIGGRSLLDRARRALGGPTITRVLGVVLVVTAVAMITRVDIDAENWIASNIPSVNVADAFETSHSISNRLDKLHGTSKIARAQATADKRAKAAQADSSTSVTKGGKPSSLPVLLQHAPDFTGTQRWFNTPGNKPLSLSKQLKGRVVLIDFWTYTCINCIRTLPYVEAWYKAYASKGLTIVGVHSPEFSFEKDPGNVAHAIKTDGITYPVAQDNNLATWNAWGNEYWPADYLIDAKGRVRAYHFGEGDYGKAESEIRSLLAERNSGSVGARAHPVDVVNPTQVATPETYLAEPGRSSNFPGQVAGEHDYGNPPTTKLGQSAFKYSGTWTIAGEGATSGDHARLDADVVAKDTYVVLGTPDGHPRNVQVLLDGKPITAADAGPDVHDGVLTVTGQRLYHLISLADDQEHVLTLEAAPGIQAFSFTFG